MLLSTLRPCPSSYTPTIEPREISTLTKHIPPTYMSDPECSGARSQICQANPPHMQGHNYEHNPANYGHLFICLACMCHIWGSKKIPHNSHVSDSTTGERQREVQISVPFCWGGGGQVQNIILGDPPLMTISSGFGPFGGGICSTTCTPLGEKYVLHAPLVFSGTMVFQAESKANHGSVKQSIVRLNAR